MSNEPLIFVLEGENGSPDVEYRMTLGNALMSWSKLKKAGKLFKGIGSADITDSKNDKSVDKKKLLLALLDTLLENIGEPEFNDLEHLIINNTVYVIDGKPLRLSENKETHFNNYRGHILPVVQKGLVFQFKDFLKGSGLSSLVGTANTQLK